MITFRNNELINSNSSCNTHCAFCEHSYNSFECDVLWVIMAMLFATKHSKDIISILLE